jgi:hypothetical protein
MAPVDMDNSSISPAGIRDKAQRMLGYLLGVPLPGATPPTLPSNRPVQLGQPIQPKPTLGVRPLSMGAPTVRATSPLGATLAPNTPAPASPPGLNAGAELATLAPSTPTLTKPTPAESQAAGRAEYKASLPEVTAPAGSADWYRQRAARAEFENQNPWGSPVSTHPGTLGKIGHVLGEGLNVAGDILEPRMMERIPGAQLNRQLGLASDLANAQKADEAARQQKLGEARLGDLQAQTDAEKARQAAEEQRLQNLKRSPADKFLYHDTDANGRAVAVFEGQHGIYSVPINYQPKAKTTAGGGSDFDRYYQGLVASRQPRPPAALRKSEGLPRSNRRKRPSIASSNPPGATTARAAITNRSNRFRRTTPAVKELARSPSKL